MDDHSVRGSGAGGGLMSEDNLAARIAYEMHQRGWSQERMATAMTAVGRPIHQSAISKIINPKGRRRSISVDEALAVAAVFDTPLDDLLVPLDAAHSREARELMERLGELADREQRLHNEAIALWARLTVLLDTEGVADRVAADLVHTGEYTPSGAAAALWHWLTEAGAGTDAAAARRTHLTRLETRYTRALDLTRALAAGDADAVPDARRFLDEDFRDELFRDRLADLIAAADRGEDLADAAEALARWFAAARDRIDLLLANPPEGTARHEGHDL